MGEEGLNIANLRQFDSGLRVGIDSLAALRRQDVYMLLSMQFLMVWSRRI